MCVTQDLQGQIVPLVSNIIELNGLGKFQKF